MKPIAFTSTEEVQRELFSRGKYLRRMFFGVAVMLVALGVRWVVDPYLKEQVAIGALYWAVAVTVWFAGWEAALLGSVLGYFAGFSLFIEPRGITEASTHNTVASITYALNCAIVILLGEAARRWKSQRERTQRELESRVNDLQTLVDILPCGVWIADRTGRMICGNRAAYGILGRAPPSEWEPEDDRACEQYQYFEQGRPIPYEDMPLQKVVRSGKPLTGFEYEVFFPNHESRMIYGNAAPLRDKRGNLRGVIATAIDFTNHKRLEQELTVTRDHLEQLVRERTASLQKSEQLRARSERLASVGIFASGIAHELNNPLNSIYLMAQYMLRKRGGAGIDPETIEKIKVEAQRGGQIVKNVLKLAQDQPSPRTPCHLEECVRQAIGLVHTYVDDSRVTINVFIPDDLPTVSMNRIEIEQVLLNILKNAIESTPERLQLSIVADMNGPEVELRIWNDGPAIAEEVREHIFDPFCTTRRTSGGCGLGLSLCHKIVTDHGGTITVESGVESGTMFTIRLPACEVAQPTSAREDSPARC